MRLAVAEGENLTKWERAKIPDAETLKGQKRSETSQVEEGLRRAVDGEAYAPVMAQGRLSQDQCDKDWEAWLKAARSELEGISGEGWGNAGAAYAYKDFDPVREAKEQQESEVAWEDARGRARRTLVELCSEKTRGETHRGLWRKACGIHAVLKAGGCKLGHIGDAIRDADAHHVEYLRQLVEDLRKYRVTRLTDDRRQRSKEWQEWLNQKAEAGARRAYQFPRADDFPGAEHTRHGVGEVIEANEELWGGLWKSAAGKRRHAAGSVRGKTAGEPVKVHGAKTLRAIAHSFPVHTSCPDGLPARAVGLLADDTLEVLGKMLAGYVAAGTWPTGESTANVVLIPKPTGGERPIAISRTIVRIGAKAYADEANTFVNRGPAAWNNTARGRRVGDAMWRDQVRANLDDRAGRHTVEVCVDFAEAFEMVDRGKLAEVALEVGYPASALAMGLDLYAFGRRLVYRGCVSSEQRPTRGIAAGSAFAYDALPIFQK